MNQPLVVSLDLATNSNHEFLIKDGPEETICTGTVSSDPDQLEELYQRIPDRESRDCSVVIEATGMAWFPVALFFIERGLPVYRVKAQKSEQFSTFLDRYCKTDQLDAQALARLYYVIPDQLHEVWLPLGNIQNLRRWCNRRENYVQEKSADLARFTDLIKFTLPSLKHRADQFTGKNMREIMAKAIDYRWTCSTMGKERFKRWAWNRNSSVEEDKLDTIYEAAEDAKSLYEDTEYDPHERKEEALDIMEHLQYLDKKIDQIEKKMKDQYDQVLEDKPVDSIPGIGWKTEAVIISYLGDGSRFDNLSQAQAYMGMIPETDQSGDTDRQGTDIRKDGPPLLRKFMYMAADTSRWCDPQIAKTYHDQMVNQGKVHTQAVCKCANKLLGRVMRVLDDGGEYELRDTDQNPVDKRTAREIIDANFSVPEKIRKKRRDRAG